jgi:hypothetical protein
MSHPAIESPLLRTPLAGPSHAFVLCRQCGEVLAPAHVSGGVDRAPSCSCGGGRNFVSAVEHRQQQLAG